MKVKAWAIVNKSGRIKKSEGTVFICSNKAQAKCEVNDWFGDKSLKVIPVWITDREPSDEMS